MFFLILLLSTAIATADQIPLDAAGTAATFQNEDFAIPVRYDFGTQLLTSTCANTDDLMITGITRVTGQVSCIKKTVSPCPDATFAESLKANLSSPPGLDYVCRPVVKANCPTDYVWKSIKFAELDPGPAGSPAPNCGSIGQCVYRWRNNVAWQQPWPTGNVSVSGTFCNSNVYHAVGTGACNAVTTISIPGTCYYECAPCNFLGCSTCSYQVNPTISTTYSTSGATASCALVKDQPCGSFIAGYVQWGGTCVINAPEYAPPQGACTP